MAVRMALGAGRFRLTRQLLTESMLLAVLGGVSGLLLARWSMESLAALSADKLPRGDQISIDGRVLAFTLAISLLTGMLFGLVPAFHASRLSLRESLKAGGVNAGGVFRRSRVRNLLVVSEVALSLILLVGAGLLIRSLIFLQRVDPGVDPRQALTMRVALPSFRYPTGQRRTAFYKELLQRVEALPGVRSAGVSTWLPLSGQHATVGLSIEGRPTPPAGEELSTDYRVISPGYFSALGATLLQGRELSERDNGQAPMAVVINETLAQRIWLNEDPVGKHVSIKTGENARPFSCEVVGVIKDIKEFGPAAPPIDVIYASYLQAPWIEMETRELVVRTATDPLQLSPAVRDEVRALDGEVPAYNVRALDELLAAGIVQPRFSLILLGLFAAIAFVLAIGGLYAVVAYSVAQRTHEIGIRVALGAQSGDVLKLVVGQGMKLALFGALLGLPAALGLAGLMKNLLFGVSAADPLTLAVIACLLLLVALPACYLPARRATKVDPLNALRQE
jgi:putative ABC transport system permease protein